MKVIYNLNSECEALLPKVEEVFLFEDDIVMMLLTEILTALPKRTIGMKSLSDKLIAQISFYEMPNGKVCTAAYPSSRKVDYDKFRRKIKKVFPKEGVKKYSFSGEPYSFLLYCTKNGIEKKKTSTQK